MMSEFTELTQHDVSTVVSAIRRQLLKRYIEVFVAGEYRHDMAGGILISVGIPCYPYPYIHIQQTITYVWELSPLCAIVYGKVADNLNKPINNKVQYG